MKPVTFTVYGNCEPKGSARAFVRGGRAIVTSDNPSLSKWEAAVRFAAERVVTAAGHQLFRAGVALDVTFHLPRPRSVSPRVRPLPITRPDCSKLVRAIEDPLSGLIWGDDAQVVQITARKLYTDGPSKAEVTVSQVLHPSELRGAQ